MTPPFPLPIRWYVRPVLLLVGACLGAALFLWSAERHGQVQRPPLVFVQATSVDRDAAERAIDRAQRIVRPSARRLSDAAVRAMLAHEGVALPAGPLPLPPMIEAHPATEAEARRLAEALEHIPSLAVDRSASAPARKGGTGLLLAITAALLLGLAVQGEVRTRAGTVRLLRQLGLERTAAFAQPIAAAGGSLALGMAAGGLLAWVVAR